MVRFLLRPSIVAALFLVNLAPFATSKPSVSKRWDEFEVKHAWSDVPQGWKYHEPVDSDFMFDMRIGLKQDRFGDLVDALHEVSDPRHTNYGKHLTKEQVDALVAPHPDTVHLVDSWLTAHGIDPAAAVRENGGSWVAVRVTAGQASRMLNADYGVYRHEEVSDYVVRTMSYSLPRVLHGHISVVSPTTYFSTMKSMAKTSFIMPDAVPSPDDGDNRPDVPPINFHTLATVPLTCNERITPDCLRALYNTSSYAPRATSRNAIGVAGYLNEFANYADLQTFFEKFRPEAAGVNFTTVQVNGGGKNQSRPGVEANLDIQYTEGLTFPTPNIYYSTGGSPPFKPDSYTKTNTNEPYLEWLDFILSQESIPQTISTSYAENEQTVPIDYARHVCDRFAQLGARGVSVLFASGDSGVGASNCRANDGTDRVQFQPMFPATCPFVTAVGGTTRVNPEVASKISGGGFSNYFSRPQYQDAAVSVFLGSLGSNFTGLYNSSGRAIPDVSAQAERFQVVIGGQTKNIGGTSASTPTVASVIALLNDFLLANDKPPLGFLNPMLYSTGKAGLNDITSGSNPGCRTNGFTAREGWDPVTGLGTPDFGKLQTIVS